MLKVLMLLIIASASPGRGDWALVRNPKVMEEVGIDEEKAQKIESALYERDEKLIDMRAQLQKKKLELRKLLEKSDVDEARIKGIIDEISKIKASIQYERIKTNRRIRKIIGEKGWKRWIQLRRMGPKRRFMRRIKRPRVRRAPIKSHIYY